MFQTHLLADADVQPIGDAVFTILETLGLACRHEGLLKAMAAAGAEVDLQAERARFPKSLMRDFTATLRTEGGDAALPDRPFAELGLPSVSLQVAQFYHDDETGERRSGRRDDFIALTKFGAALHPDKTVGHALTLTDVPALHEPLEAALLLAEYAERPGVAFAWHVDQADWLCEMGDALGIDRWYSYGATTLAHPLRFDRDTANKFVRRMKTATQASLTSMPVPGVSAPVTLPGFIALSAAEYVAFWFMARAVAPDCTPAGSLWVGTMDMRSGEVSYSAHDAMAYGFAACEFVRRFCGVAIHVGGGEYCAAKRPGLYATLEKAHKAMTIAAFSGTFPCVGDGMLDNGKTISPVQLLLDRDTTAAMNQYARPVAMSDDALALDTILTVDCGLDRNYLDTDHTLRHFRDALWLPDFLDRTGWNGPDAEAAQLDTARARVRDLIAAYRKPDRDPALLAQLRGIVERAKKKLV